MRKLLILCFVSAFISNYVFAAKIYKCTNSKGEIEFKGKPCPKTQSSEIIKIYKAPVTTKVPTNDLPNNLSAEQIEKARLANDTLDKQAEKVRKNKEKNRRKSEKQAKKRKQDKKDLCNSFKYFYDEIKRRGPLPGVRGRMLYKERLNMAKRNVDRNCR